MPDNDNINNEELVLDEIKPAPEPVDERSPDPDDLAREFEEREAALAAALAEESREGKPRFNDYPSFADAPVIRTGATAEPVVPGEAEEPVILSERSESKDLTSPEDILSEAKNPASDSSPDAAPDAPDAEGETPALDYVAMTLSAGIAPLEMRFAQINSCYRRLPIAYRSFTYLNSVIEGVIPPERYAYAADETDRGERLARWNITQAAKAVRAFEAAGRNIEFVTARCSPSLLRQPDMYAWMKELLASIGFTKPEKLCLEFPRTLLYEDYEAVRPSLLALKLLKVRTLMTGCGERDCPVTALIELPVDMVLLAPRVSALSDNRDKNHVFTGFIGFLRSLPVDVIGDGIYNDEQITIHSRADCFGYAPSAGYAGSVTHGSLRMTLEEAVSQKEEDL